MQRQLVMAASSMDAETLKQKLFSVDIGGTNEAERRRREDRGAEGAEGCGVWGGGVPIFFRFLSSKGEFWCILGAIFCS